MLNNIRNFSKTIFAKVLLVIIIIPFIFWGMGGVFSSGNSNNIAKINNQNISTQDFIDFLNLSKIDNNYIRENIENNALEELLSQLISQKMLDLEINSLNLEYTDQMLNKKIRSNKNFEGDDKKFSRIKYEKFLLSTNTSAPEFEFKLRQNELKKNLFAYTGGGLKSPFFFTNNLYINQTKKIIVDFINLEKVYKKRNQFTNKEIELFIEENKDTLKEKFINFNYTIIDPSSLNGINEYNDLFFKKIDDIENEISKGFSFNQIIKKYELKKNYSENISLNNLDNLNKNKKFYKKIIKNSEINKINLLDENEYYVLYEVIKVNEVIPSRDEKLFNERILKQLVLKNKFEFNRNLIKKITDKKFDQNDFDKISKSNSINIESYEIKSVRDNKKFSTEGVKFLYTKSKDDFTLISNDQQSIFLVKIKNIIKKNISKDDKNFINYEKQANIKIRDQIYSSYDVFLNTKYKVTVNNKTLDRVKNYFK